ncbi:MAG TPA: hypothetical protein VEL05_10215 [Candidatus Acidoferrum sp.]|nr:hypothetical protein [Candidatus Acidoferrum sp.]
MSRCLFAVRALALSIALISWDCHAGLSGGSVDRQEEVSPEEGAPGPALAGAVSIDWCAGRSLARRIDLTAVAVSPAAFDNARLASIARAGCSDSLSPEQRDEVLESYRALRDWSKLSADEVRDYLSALTEEPGPVERACRDLKPADDTRRGLARLLLCDRSETLPLEDDTSSALASAAAVYHCFDASRRSAGASSRPPRATFALCGAEFRRLDRSALERELTALAVHPAVRTRVLIGLRQIETVLASLEEELGPRLARDPLLHAFFYETAEDALREAERIRREGAEELAAVRAYEARFGGGLPPRVTGCFAELRPRFIAFLRRAGVTTLAGARREMVKPIGYQLARALESCARYDGQGELAELLAREIQDARYVRGPRTILYWRLRDALEEDMKAGKRPLELRELDDAGRYLQVPVPLGPVRSVVHEEIAPLRILKAAPRAGGVRLEFEKQVGARTAPAFIAAENAAGLAPGRPIVIFCDDSKEPRVCAPLAVWQDPNQDGLASFLGAEL